MNFDLLFLSFSNLKGNKKRTFLSVLAISIGVFSLVTLTSISKGLNENIVSKLKGFGSDVIIVVPTKVENAVTGSTRAGFKAFEGRFYESDAKKLKSLNGVKSVSYVLQGRTTVTYRNETKSISVYAVEPKAYLVFSRDIKIKEGRWIRKGAYEAVLGGKVSDNFEKSISVGKSIVIAGKTLKVVGILEETGNSISQLDNVILIPFFVGREIYSDRFAEKEVSALLIQVAEGYNTKDVGKNVENYLMKIKKISKQEDKFFTLITKDFIENSISQIISLLNAFFVGVSFVSIVVGLVGVGNSIYMSVIEKTREIGTLRAVGMRKGDVLKLYIFQAIILSFAGFVFGFLLSYVILFIVSSLLPSKLDYLYVVFALVISLFGTIIASYLPSKKASEIQPAEALIYE